GIAEETGLGILRERRATMYDPVVVDAFVAAHRRIMPAGDPTPHPVARAVGSARAMLRDAPEAQAPPPPGESAIADEALAVGSLARAMCGEASLRDAGALVWMLVRQMLPCAAAMALFVPEEEQDSLAVRYAAGAHQAPVLVLLAPHLATSVAAPLDLDEPQTHRSGDLKLVHGASA